jgi:hypothetical protein
MAVMKAKVPAVLASGIICLVLGGGIGAVTVWAATGKHVEQASAAPDGEGDGKAPNAKGGLGGKGGPGGAGGPGGGKGKGAPNPKAQLAQLVTKLDVLTTQSLHVDLTPDQKKQAKELLADLGQKPLSNEEAQEKFEKLVAILEPNRKVLEDAGFRQGGGGGGPGGGGEKPDSNPFTSGAPADRLKSLRATLGK